MCCLYTLYASISRKGSLHISMNACPRYGSDVYGVRFTITVHIATYYYHRIWFAYVYDSHLGKVTHARQLRIPTSYASYYKSTFP